MRNRPIKLITVLAILEPIVYFLLVTLMSVARENYNLTKNYMSELSSAQVRHHVGIGMATFSLLGAVIILYSYVLRTTVARHTYTSAAQLFLVISGASVVLLGVIPADRGLSTMKGKWHWGLTAPAAVGIPLAQFCYYFILKNDIRWGDGWAYYSAMMGSAIVVLDLMIFFKKPKQYIGIIQRLAVGAALIWIVTTAIKVSRAHNY